MGWFDRGRNDQQQNKGAKNDFSNSNDREKYNAGKADEKQQQQQRQQDQQNKKK